jgi:Calx-beta domain
MIRNLLSLLFCLLCVSSVSALELTVNKPSANEEGESTGEFLFTRKTGDALTAAITINWEIVMATTARNAIKVTDYTLIDENEKNDKDKDKTPIDTTTPGSPPTIITKMTGTITLAENATSTKLIVKPVNDSEVEGAEDVTITLLSGTGYVITGQQAQTITIHDNDATASITSPIPTAYEDYSTKVSPVGDLDRSYRGVFEVSLEPNNSLNGLLNTYIITTLSAGGSIGKATLKDDYNVFYKIGGSDIGYGMGYKIIGTHAYDVGTKEIKINSGSAPIPQGSTVSFSGDTNTYTVDEDYVGGAGTLKLSEGIRKGLANQTPVSITLPAVPSGYQVNQPADPPAGSQSVTISGGVKPIPQGAIITFNSSQPDPKTPYTVTARFNGGTGALSFFPGLSASSNVTKTTTITVSYETQISPTGFKVNQSTAPVTGATTVTVNGGNQSIGQGAQIYFGTDTAKKYTVTERLNGGSGLLKFTPALSADISDGTAITVTYVNLITDYVVNQPNDLVLKGVNSFSVKDGIGGFKKGDVFQIGDDKGTRYTVETATGFTPGNAETKTDGIITFKPFTGPSESGGIPKTVPADTTILTYFPAEFTGLEMKVFIPKSATKVQYGIVPVSDTKEPSDKAIEGAEKLYLTLLNSADYKLADKTITNMTITDDEIVASFDDKPTNATADGTPGSFTVNFSGGVFPDDVEVNYSIAPDGDDPKKAKNGVDIVPALTGKLLIPKGANSGVITVNAKADATDGEVLTLTLLANDNYRLAPTTGTPPNASASITINDSLGLASITPKTPTVQESPNNSTVNCFTLTVDRGSNKGVPITVGPAITVPLVLDTSGTASVGSDFENIPTSVTIAKDTLSVDLPIKILSDIHPEPTEKIKVKILGGFGYLVKDGASTAEISLTDDEPVFSVVKKSGLTNITEGKSEALFTISYVESLPSGGLTVPFTLGGKATSSDYTPPTVSSITFTSSDGKSKDLIIPIIDDNTAEGNEDLTLTLTAAPTLYFLADDKKTASVTIEDNLVTLSLVVTNATEGATGKFAITSNAKPSKPLTLNYKVSTSSTATPRNAGETKGGDYEKLSGTVEITESTADILVKTFTDSEFEPQETVEIEFTLSDPPAFKTSGTTFPKATMTIFDEKPTVVSVFSTKSDGTYKAKDLIPISVEFSAEVSVTGNPQLVLETGDKDAIATFTDVSGKFVNFTYVVDYNHETNNLDYNSTAALSLNGGTIKKAGSSADAHLILPAPNNKGSLGYEKARVIAGGNGGGKPDPGIISNESGGGCGLGSGFAAFATLLLFLGIRLREIRKP